MLSPSTTRRDLLLAAAAAALTAGCRSTRIDMPPAQKVAGAIPSDWPSASPESQGIDAAALADALDAGARLPAMRSLVVVRNGMLVGERYYGGATVDELLPINSVTKSVSSMLVGQAFQRGQLPGLSATVGSLLPEAAARAPGSVVTGVSLQQILSGRTGLDYDWRTQTPLFASAADPVQFALGLTASKAGPDAWSYNDAAVGLLSPILQRAHGLDMADVASRDLFAPLGIERLAWRRDRTGNPLAYGGLVLRTRDLAKLAWTMVDGGKWRGTQVLPASWVAESTRPRGPADWRVTPITDIGYGDLWFTGSMHGRRVVWGWGYGAQFALLVPELRMAVVTAALAPRVDAYAQNNAVMALVAQVVRATGAGPSA
ncbi:serine hydrolase domain-containing protein [Variovorax rhizosphaerae]|uniref:Serine hydrolase n=1 Tax=Variovorax rhizosphaerae TaxID=1836200 RepID=A0ABU8WP68_9BURK